MKMQHVNIFGVYVDNFSKNDIHKNVENFLISQNFHQIATVNPEFLLEARKNEQFRTILNNCDLTVADGVGLNIAFWRQGAKMKHRYPGIDLMWAILEYADQNDHSVFLAAEKDGLSAWSETASAIIGKYPRLKIKGIDLDSQRVDILLSGLSDEIEGSQIIFCNFGAPEQECFLNTMRNANIDSIRLVMGVGGSFDFITNKAQRAPLWMQKSGLEWLYRLFKQPQRLKRILNATIVFPILILFSQDHDK